MSRPCPRTPPDVRVLALLLIGLAGCDAAPPPSHVGARDRSPLAELAPPPPAEARWHGVVVQALDAKPYTYLAVRDGEALRWVAIMGPGQEPGAHVAIRTMGVQRDFHSRRLDRTFDELVFGAIEAD